MNRKILERRLEMLDYSFSGARTTEWIPKIASKFSVSESAIWSDWTRRPLWLPKLLNLDEGAFKVDEILARLELALSRAFNLMLNTKNESVKIGAIRTIDSISKSLFTLGVESGTYPSLLKDVLDKLVKLEGERE